MPDPTANLAYAFGIPEVEAEIRVRAEDFTVEELLRFDPTGEGSHAYLKIKKRGLNTRGVAKTLARHAGVRPVDVGFAGMKDRNAITTQWFSVALAGRDDPDWRALNSDAIEVLEAVRHEKKLRPGQLAQNRFCITLRSLRGDREALNERLDRIARRGVPNYFGPQRFGRDGGNIEAARDVFSGARRVRDRKLKGIYLSAARAEIFNQVLSARVRAGSWNRVLPGEVLMFDDSRSRFPSGDEDLSADPRIETLELHPTGPLWGKGSPDADGEAGEIEKRVAEGFAELTAGLEAAGLEADRRALRLRLDMPGCGDLDKDGVSITFALRPGAFATAALREIVRVREQAPVQPG